MSTYITPSVQPFDEAEYKKRLMEEYKIVQDKIDKIGGFRFTIKGWSVTAVIAASAAGVTTDAATAVTLSLGLAFMAFWFFQFERQQVELRTVLSTRAGKLEQAFWRLDRKKTARAPILVPFTAQDIAQAHHARTVRSNGFWGNLTSPHWWAGRRSVYMQADILFYFLLIILAFLPLLPHRDAIRIELKQFRTHGYQDPPSPPRPFTGPLGLLK